MARRGMSPVPSAAVLRLLTVQERARLLLGIADRLRRGRTPRSCPQLVERMEQFLALGLHPHTTREKLC